MSYADVLKSFVNPNVSRRSDIADVVTNLQRLINRYVEVMPVVLLMAHSHRQLYVY